MTSDYTNVASATHYFY